MSNWVRFDKHRYHQVPEMRKWLNDNIGPGTWVNGDDVAEIKLHDYNSVWGINQMFGTTKFTFIVSIY